MEEKTTNTTNKQLNEIISPIEYWAGKLMPKQKAFADNYLDPDSPTYGNKSASYIRAGYADNAAKGRNACKLLEKRELQEYCKHWRADFAGRGGRSLSEILDKEYTLQQLRYLIDDCKANSDRSNLKGAIHLLMQFNRMLSNVNELQINDVTTPALTDAERDNLRKLARQHNIQLSTADYRIAAIPAEG